MWCSSPRTNADGGPSWSLQVEEGESFLSFDALDGAISATEENDGTTVIRLFR